MQIVYSTHATSTDNVAGISSGHADPDLAPRGIEDCAERRARWAQRHFDLVVASDLLRSRRTAELVLEDRDTPLRIDPRLRECNYGDLNGAPRAEIDAIRASRVTEPYPGGESYEDVAIRTRSMLDDLAREHPDGELLLIGAIEMALRREMEILTLEVRISNEPAIALYEKYGLRQVGLRKGYYSDNHEDAIIMSTDSLRSGALLASFHERIEKHEERYGDAERQYL